MIFYHQKDRENMLIEFLKVKLEVLHSNNWDIEPDFFWQVCRVVDCSKHGKKWML